MFSIKSESRFTKTALLIILGVFLFSCIFTSLFYNDNLLLGNFQEFNNDDVKYLRSADTLLKTGKLTYNYPDTPTVFIMPGITFLLTPFVAIFGLEGAVMPVRIFFAFLQTFNLFLIFLIARKVFHSKVALLTTALSLLYLPNIYVSTVILTEPITFTFFLLVLYLVLWGSEKKEKRYFIIGGILWGLSVMFRPTMAALPLVIFIYWLFKKFTFKDILKYALCAIIPFILILSPWVIRNYVTFDRFIPLTLSSGSPKFQGAIINYSPEESARMMSIIKTDDIIFADNEIVLNEAETIMANRIIEYNMKTNPVKYILWYTLGKTIYNFALPYIWYPIGGSYIPISIYHVLLLALFIIGIFKLSRLKAKTPNINFLLITVLFFNCIHLPFYCFARYVYPVMFIVVMIAAYTVYDWYEKKHLTQENAKI